MLSLVPSGKPKLVYLSGKKSADENWTNSPICACVKEEKKKPKKKTSIPTDGARRHLSGDRPDASGPRGRALGFQLVIKPFSWILSLICILNNIESEEVGPLLVREACTFCAFI